MSQITKIYQEDGFVNINNELHLINFSIKPNENSDEIIISNADHGRFDFLYTQLRDRNDNTFGSKDAAIEYLKSVLNISAGVSIKSVGNSSTTTIANGASFVGEAELNNQPSVMVHISTDQNGTFYLEFSQNGIDWDTSLLFKYDTSRINPPHILEKGNRYFRVRFVNDSGSAQTYFRMVVSYGSFQKLTSPINSTLAENYDATVVRPTDYKYEVAMGKRQGRTTWNKFGYNLDINTASPEIVTSFGGVFDPTTAIITTAQTFTIAYNSGTDGLGTTGALSLLFTYLDGNFNSQIGIHTLGNTGSDVTSFTGL